jgi:hypothetical protein
MNAPTVGIPMDAIHLWVVIPSLPPALVSFHVYFCMSDMSHATGQSKF